jgi:TMEM175 potassium channel family protein
MSERHGGRLPLELTTERLEAFSDAVIAVIMTILALELRPPDGTSKEAISGAVPGLLIYVLAFVNLAIWWNNHHHLLRATERINGAVMWANMALLFFLSLIPVATEWVRNVGLREPDTPGPPAFFGIVSLAAAIAYAVLTATIVRANGADSLVARSLHGNAKGIVSVALYAIAVVAAIATGVGYISYALYVGVAIIWIVPDRRFLHDHPDGDDEHADRESGGSAPGHPV